MDAIGEAAACSDAQGSSHAFDLGDGRTLPLLRVTVDGKASLMALVPLDLDGFDRVDRNPRAIGDRRLVLSGTKIADSASEVSDLHAL